MESIGEDTPLKSEALREVSPYEPPLPERKGPSRFRYFFLSHLSFLSFCRNILTPLLLDSLQDLNFRLVIRT